MTDTDVASKGRRLPRALTPFRHSAYRRLAVALVLATFAGGVWVVGLVWEVIRLDGGPAQLSAGVDRQRRRRAAAGAARRRRRRPGAAEGDPARRRHDRGRLHGRWSRCFSVTDLTRLWQLAVVALRDRRRDGVLLPGLLGLAAGARARGGPARGQRVRGDDPPDDRPGARPGRRGRRRRRRVARAPRSSVAALARWPDSSRWRRSR